MNASIIKKLLQASMGVYTLLLLSPVFANDDTIRDPFENFNRPIFEFNMFLDRAALKPFAKTYKYITPKSIQQPLETFVSQFSYPVSALNYALQGDFESAGYSLLKMSVNFILTLGMGDIDLHNIPYEHQTAEKTMAKSDIGSGPYVVIPLSGHNMARGHAGRLVDVQTQNVFANQYLNTPILFALQTVINRSKIMDAADNFEETSLDYYATVRSITMQRSDSYETNNRFDDLSDFDFSE